MKDRSPNMSDIHRASDQREVLPPCPRRLTPMVLKRVRAGRHHHYVGKFECATCHRTVTQAIELTSSPPLAIAPVPSRADLMRRGRLGPLVIASARFVQRGYDSAHPGILLSDARRPADPCFNYRPQPAETRPHPYSRGQVQITNLQGLRKEACECYAVVKCHYDRLLN